MSRYRLLACSLIGVLLLGTATVSAQSFDFDRLNRQMRSYTVVLNLKVEIALGTQTNEHEQRLLGTIVSEDGLAIFDGSLLQEENPFLPSMGFSFRVTPQQIEAVDLDGNEYEAEYVGVDRFTGLAFVQLHRDDAQFRPVRFVDEDNLKLGDWLATYSLLPDYVEPPITADIGMISALITGPEEFALTVGFNGMEFGSVLYDNRLRPIGLLGELTDPASGGAGQGAFMDSFDRGQMPLLGVITAERLERMIADPPQRGKVDRSWLGITMQALTEDIAAFLGIADPGGIVVNDVVPGSPADSAGIVVGDVIFAVNDQPVTVDRDEELPVFQRMVSTMVPGTRVEIATYRPGDDGIDTLRLTTLLAAAPLAASDAEESEFLPFELTVRDLVFSDFINYNVEQNSLSGVVVAELQSGGLADIGGLRPGDVIQRVNDVEIESVEQFTSTMTVLEDGKPSEVVIFVYRFGQTLFVNIKTDW